MNCKIANCLTFFIFYQCVLQCVYTKTVENLIANEANVNIPNVGSQKMKSDLNHQVSAANAAAPDTAPDSAEKNDNNVKLSKISDNYALTRLVRKPTNWEMGTVPYYLDDQSYDEVIADRIRAAMDVIESSSCVVFKEIKNQALPKHYWLLITNPSKERECVHKVDVGSKGELMLVIGYDCMSSRDILHALLHVLGFHDEVTHPQRDTFIRVLWENIHPQYRPLFRVNTQEEPHKTRVEYDSMSIMHFHDRAYSANGKPTIVPLIPGLMITPTDSLSQLDIMKLGLAYGHECNKRKVGQLIDSCKKTLNGLPSDESKETEDHLVQYDEGVEEKGNEHEKVDQNAGDAEENLDDENQNGEDRNSKERDASRQPQIGKDYEKGADIEAPEEPEQKFW